MRRIWMAVIAAMGFFVLRGVEPLLSTDPVAPVAGETFTVLVTLDAPGTPEFTLPEVPGLRSSRRVTSTRSSIRIVNGRQEQSFQYGVAALAEHPGPLTIPAFTLTLDGKPVPVPAYTFTVRDPAQLSAPDGRNADRPQAALQCLPDRPVYVGETVEAKLDVMVPEGIQAVIRDIRESGFGDALFLPQGPGKMRFVNSGRRRVVRQGTRYLIHELTARFQPQQPGTFTPVCELAVAVSTPAGDDFFGGFFTMGATRELLIHAAAERKLTVRSLPEVPAGAADLGLVGDWRAELTAPTETEIRTGSVAELTLNVSGSGAAEIFHAPALTVPQARMYPPEVKRTAHGFVVKYLFVPLAPGPREMKIDFAVFDPVRGTYRVEPCAVKFEVVPGSTALPTTTAPLPTTVTAESAETGRAPAPGGWFTRLPGRKVRVPLWENSRGGIILFTGIGAAGFILGAVRRRNGDGAHRARREARRRLKALAARLQAAPDAAQLLRDEGVAEIAAARGLPPGATPDEIAETIADPELRTFFRTLGDAAFHPGAAAPAEPEVRRKLVKFLRRALLFLLTAAVAFDAAAYQPDAAYRACDEGRYAEARRMFHRMLDPDAPDPNLLYNCGGTSTLLGDFPAATLEFEQALLLSPGDPGIRTAFHDSLKKLAGAPEEPDHSFSGFLAGLRDRWRPDHYLLLAAVLFGAAGVLSLCRRFPGKTALYAVLAAGILLAVLAAVTQSLDRYSPDRARVVAVRAELHRIPAANGSVAGIVPGGTGVRVIERHGGWVQIRLPGGSGGWVEAAQIKPVCPHGVW